jgi:hypothetical protein
LWSLVMLAWLSATRIPTMIKGKITHDPRQPFLCGVACPRMAGAGAGLNAILTWIYLGLGIARSLVHALVNIVILRFALFIAASLVLLIPVIRAAIIFFDASTPAPNPTVMALLNLRLY